jgi:hypothetical protein
LTRDIPPLKAKPETIPWVLKILRDNEGNFKKMENSIVEYWRKISLRKREPSRKNSLRAVFGPTLRHLQLIRGEGDDIKLLPKAKELLESYGNVGEAVFKQKFAEHLLKLEETKWINLSSELYELEHISIESLLGYLARKYPVSRIDETKLRKYLSYLEYVGLVSFSEGEVIFRKTLYQSLIRGLRKEISEDAFRKILFESYMRLRAKQTSSYVPIPDVRDAVCEVTGIWPNQFDQLLMKIPKETPEYLIYLSQPMMRESGGIRVGDKYFYYIAIYINR